MMGMHAESEQGVMERKGEKGESSPPGGGVLPYISHIGMSHPKGFGFCAVLV